MELNKIYQGDALEVLKTFPDNSINCCCTSPPYWSCRDYHAEGQMGMEESPLLYVSKLGDIFDEVRRVIRSDGVCYLNIGDIYTPQSSHKGGTFYDKFKGEDNWGERSSAKDYIPSWGKHKELVGLPWMVAFELQRRGWYLRQDIIWAKRNPMPLSMKDRYTSSHEYIFMLTKSKNYWFKQQFEPLNDPKATSKNATNKKEGYNNATYSGFSYDAEDYPMGRNMRDVWYLSTKPYKGAHFATYPIDIPLRAINSGCPLKICDSCGEPVKVAYQKVEEFASTEEKETITEWMRACGADKDLKYNGESTKDYSANKAQDASKTKQRILEGMSKPKKWVESPCNCGATFSPGVVLDPFMGSGTTAVAAKQVGVNFVGIDLNPEYIKLAYDRLSI